MTALDITNLVEKYAAKPLTFLVFNACIIGGLWWQQVDYTNISISIVTADLMLLLLIGQRVGTLAMQAKLDELIHAINEARDDVAHIEDQGEEAIERLRNDEVDNGTSSR
jgi:low affinity Fe/Cu permease